LDGVVEKELKDGEELDMVEMRDEVMNFLIAVSGLFSLSSRLETEAEKQSLSLLHSFSFSILFLQGEETTASTLRWLVRYLAEDTGPELQRRLRKELMEALPTFGEQDPTFDEIHQLDAPCQCLSLPFPFSLLSRSQLHSFVSPDFESVIQELLRLSSTVSVSYRKSKLFLSPSHRLLSLTLILLLIFSALVPTTILGHAVPPNTEILMLVGMLGRTTGEGGWKEDATKFRPERWLDADGRFNPKVRQVPLALFLSLPPNRLLNFFSLLTLTGRSLPTLLAWTQILLRLQTRCSFPSSSLSLSLSARS